MDVNKLNHPPRLERRKYLSQVIFGHSPVAFALQSSLGAEQHALALAWSMQ